MGTSPLAKVHCHLWNSLSCVFILLYYYIASQSSIMNHKSMSLKFWCFVARGGGEGGDNTLIFLLFTSIFSKWSWNCIFKPRTKFVKWWFFFYFKNFTAWRVKSFLSQCGFQETFFQRIWCMYVHCVSSPVFPYSQVFNTFMCFLDLHQMTIFNSYLLLVITARGIFFHVKL